MPDKHGGKNDKKRRPTEDSLQPCHKNETAIFPLLCRFEKISTNGHSSVGASHVNEPNASHCADATSTITSSSVKRGGTTCSSVKTPTQSNTVQSTTRSIRGWIHGSDPIHGGVPETKQVQVMAEGKERERHVEKEYCPYRSLQNQGAPAPERPQTARTPQTALDRQAEAIAQKNRKALNRFSR